MIRLPLKHRLLLTVAPLVILLDQWSKHEILKRYSLGETLPVFRGFFDFTYVQNTGAAFGILAQADPAFRVPFFLLVPLIALAVVFYVLSKVPARDVRMSLPLALVTGGAIGNLIDRATLGFVVDFLHFHHEQYHFHVFNIADSAICIGVAGLFLDLMMRDEKKTVAHST